MATLGVPVTVPWCPQFGILVPLVGTNQDLFWYPWYQGLVTILWYIFIFSLCFGESVGFFGNPGTYVGMKSVSASTPLMRRGGECAACGPFSAGLEWKMC